MSFSSSAVRAVAVPALLLLLILAIALSLLVGAKPLPASVIVDALSGTCQSADCTIVLDARLRPCLGRELCPRRRLSVLEQLQGDFTSKLDVEGTIDDPHASSTNALNVIETLEQAQGYARPPRRPLHESIRRSRSRLGGRYRLQKLPRYFIIRRTRSAFFNR